jgi:hypothetical protein
MVIKRGKGLLLSSSICLVSFLKFIFSTKNKNNETIEKCALRVGNDGWYTWAECTGK